MPISEINSELIDILRIDAKRLHPEVRYLGAKALSMDIFALSKDDNAVTQAYSPTSAIPPVLVLVRMLALVSSKAI
jgi:hypothetical protein